MTQRNKGEDVRDRFTELTRPLVPDLYRYAVWLSRDPALAQDVVQECLLRAWRSFDRLRDSQAIKPWLITILRREHARHYERVRPPLVDIDDLPGSDEQRLATWEDDDGDVREVRAAMLKLAPEYREPLVLQVLLGHTAEEIGEIIGIRSGAVLTRLYRARKQLRELLEDGAVADRAAAGLDSR